MAGVRVMCLLVTGSLYHTVVVIVMVAAVKYWNALSYRVVAIGSVNSFKSTVHKTFGSSVWCSYFKTDKLI